MASLEPDERNIVEAEEINWRLVVYPILAVVVAVVAGFGIYYHQVVARENSEQAAAAALDAARTPTDIAAVVAGYPGTTQASIGLMRAANLSFAEKDYDTAAKNYQRVIDSSESPPELRDSAELGLASVQEANGNGDDAIKSYLEVAQKGSASPFAPVAYHQVAAIYASRKDAVHEEQILQQAVRLGGESPFVKEAQDRLKELAPDTTASTNAAPAAP
jgi:predicted negative regulator of RcsB-dependent stress response